MPTESEKPAVSLQRNVGKYVKWSLVCFLSATLVVSSGENVLAESESLSDDVRIGLYIEVGSANLSSGSFRLHDLTTGKYEDLARPEETKIVCANTGLRFGTRTFGKRIRVESLKEDWPKVNGRPYRGALEFVWRAPAKLTVVNFLPVDDYVKGILVYEVSPDWPMESLKAQAVISRTYALKNRGRHGKDGFDLCAEPHCQVYRGQSAERKKTDKAVTSTQNEVVYSDGKMLSTVFHSNCGGYTENAANVWEGSGHPALRAVRCKWCRGNPKYFWKAEIPTEKVGQRLSAGGFGVGRPKSLKVLSRSTSGRAYEIRVTGTTGRVDLRANQFRNLMDGRVMRSTLWTAVSTGRKSWRFSGKGWGHGVGLCQFGAKGMADKGWDYERILRFYYRRGVVKKVKT